MHEILDVFLCHMSLEIFFLLLPVSHHGVKNEWLVSNPSCVCVNTSLPASKSLIEDYCSFLSFSRMPSMTISCSLKTLELRLELASWVSWQQLEKIFKPISNMMWNEQSVKVDGCRSSLKTWMYLFGFTDWSYIYWPLDKTDDFRILYFHYF